MRSRRVKDQNGKEVKRPGSNAWAQGLSLYQPLLLKNFYEYMIHKFVVKVT